jgi:hypothetical protein
MSRRGKIVVAVSVIWIFAGTAYWAHRRGLLQLLSLPLFLGMLAAIPLSFIWIFRDWRQHRWLAALPFMVCILSFVGSFQMAMSVRDRLFDWALPSYEMVVQQMQAGRFIVTTNWSQIPGAEAQARLAYEVYAQKDTNGVFTVEFLTEGGFPARHSGYLYSSSGVIEPGSLPFARWPPIKLRPKWFYVSH